MAAGSKRHSELRCDIAGVSQKMLTQTLRGLERDGMVQRSVTPSVPLRVDYELTPLGHDLAPELREQRDDLLGQSAHRAAGGLQFTT